MEPVPSDRDTAGLRGHRLRSKPDAHSFSQTEEALSLAPVLPGSVSKPRQKATLPPPDRQPTSPGPCPSVGPFSQHPPQGAAQFPSEGPAGRQQGQGRLRQSGSPSSLPTRQFQRLNSVGVAGDAPKPDGFRAFRKISCLTFTPAAYSSQNMRCVYSGKLSLTYEITFRAVINIPGSRVSAV